MVNTDKRYIVDRFGVIELFKNKNGFFQDENGTLFSLRNSQDDLDPVDRCGIWPIALPLTLTPEVLQIACRVHDHLYSDVVYQAFNERKDADLVFKLLAKQGGFWSRLLIVPFYRIVRWFGGFAWENKATK